MTPRLDWYEIFSMPAGRNEQYVWTLCKGRVE